MIIICSNLYFCFLFLHVIMLKSLFKIFILFPMTLVVSIITTLCVGIHSLYKTISDLNFKRGYAFYMLGFTVSMCYMFSELIATSSGSHFLVVLLSCYAMIVTFSSIYITYNSKVDNPLHELTNSFAKANEFFTYNNLDASLNNFSCEIDEEDKPSPDL